MSDPARDDMADYALNLSGEQLLAISTAVSGKIMDLDLLALAVVGGRETSRIRIKYLAEQREMLKSIERLIEEARRIK